MFGIPSLRDGTIWFGSETRRRSEKGSFLMLIFLAVVTLTVLPTVAAVITINDVIEQQHSKEIHDEERN